MLHFKVLIAIIFSTTSTLIYISSFDVKDSPSLVKNSSSPSSKKYCDTKWSAWSECCSLNREEQNASRVRTRTSCDYGVHKDYESCLLPPWSEWSSCSKSCGVGGMITRTRLICERPSQIKQIEQKACPKPSHCYGNAYTIRYSKLHYFQLYVLDFQIK